MYDAAIVVSDIGLEVEPDWLQCRTLFSPPVELLTACAVSERG
jgi:hypothetical protein